MPTRVAFIGAGPAARQYHLASLVEMPDVEIAAVCELNAERRESAARDFHIARQFDDYRAMLSETAPDAVYIIMYAQHLDPLVTHCLNEGFHVFIEKPAGVNSDQPKRWAELAAKRSRLTMVGFNRRFAPLITEFRRRVEESGPIRTFLVEFYKPQPAEAPDDVIAPLAFVNQGSHHADLLRWLGGEPDEVHTFPDRCYATWLNAVTAVVRFQSGAVGTLTYHFGAGTQRLERIVLHGNHVTGVIQDTNVGGIIGRSGKQEELTRGDLSLKPGYHHEYGYFLENRHFIECLQRGAQPETCFADSAKTMALIEALTGRKAAG